MIVAEFLMWMGFILTPFVIIGLLAYSIYYGAIWPVVVVAVLIFLSVETCTKDVRKLYGVLMREMCV